MKESIIMELLKISPSNAKIGYESLSLLSGHSCPFALDCLAKVDLTTFKIIDGKDAEFRCFSATAEAAFPSVRRQRQHNFDELRNCDTVEEMVELLTMSIRPSYAPFRIHVGGEFFNQKYFDAWIEYAKRNPQRIFYAYTKSLPYWVARIDSIPANLSLTASRGGRMDHLIDEYGLKEAVVVFSEEEAAEKNLEIDHDDSLAIENNGQSFALLLHGTQKAQSPASEAIKTMKAKGTKFSYAKSA
mgnify:FL=1|tara:strand:+ start:826 stop:1557 length:732 start_codon:yes stop_codon:yes gene_type:complete